MLYIIIYAKLYKFHSVSMDIKMFTEFKGWDFVFLISFFMLSYNFDIFSMNMFLKTINTLKNCVKT